MRTLILSTVTGLLLATAASAQPAPSRRDLIMGQPRPASAYVAAIADSHRPAKDKARDADRKPAEVLSFIGVKPGDKVADIMPGEGYFTRMFSTAVGSKGRVYAVEPTEMSKVHLSGLAALKTITDDPVYANVTVINVPAGDIAAGSGAPPEPFDVVWTSQNYHDLHDKFMGPVDVAGFNKAVFAALKPGGVYVVLDHAALSGTGLSTTDTLHRIDPATVRAEVTAAGFAFEGESPALRNAADPKTANVFDKRVRGHTDQFLFKFRKPVT